MVRNANSSNELLSSISGVVDAKMTSSVSGDATAVCNNIQRAENVSNCSIKFDEQMCNVLAVSNMTSSTAMEADLSQAIMSEASQAASSTTSGLAGALADTSSASNVVHNYMEMSMSATTAFTTTCTRNATAINEQSVTNCENSTIEFAKQDVSAEVVGDCVANQVGSLSAHQALTSLIDMEATATVKGIELWLMFIVFLGIYLLFSLGRSVVNAAKRMLASKEDTGLTADQKAELAQANNRLLVIQVLTVAMAVVAILWWPGAGSFYLGIFPWKYRIPDEINGHPSGCYAGEAVDQQRIINKWVWHDPKCLSQWATTGAGVGDGSGRTSCSKEEQIIHYRNCGIFAGCKNETFLKEKEAYLSALRVCGDLVGAPFESCNTASIAATVFASAIGDLEPYEGCHMCTGNSEDERKLPNRFINRGLFVRDGKSCAKDINHLAYRATRDSGCLVDDEGNIDVDNCFPNEEEFAAASPNECDHTGYQIAKRKFSYFLQACKAVAAHRASVGDGDGNPEPIVRDVCPPNSFNYITKCNSTTKECTYEAFNKNDPLEVAACRNNLDVCCGELEDGSLNCVDEQYRLDLIAYRKANEACRARHDDRAALHPWGWVAPLIFYFLCLALMVFILIRSPSASAALSTGAKAASTGAFWYGRFIIVFLAVCLVGVSLILHSGPTWPFPADAHDGMDSYDPYTARMAGYGLAGAGGGLALIFFGLLLRWRFYGRQNAKENAAVATKKSQAGGTGEK
jgi:hypothetical protein